MEADFSIFEKAIKDHVYQLQDACTGVTDALKAENHRLRKELEDAQAVPWCSSSSIETQLRDVQSKPTNGALPSIPAEFDELAATPREVFASFRLGPSSPRQQPVRTPRLSSTPPDLSQVLCVTPRISQDDGCQKTYSQMLWQPLKPENGIAHEPKEYSERKGEQGLAKSIGGSSASIGVVSELLFRSTNSSYTETPPDPVADRWAMLFAVATGLIPPKRATQSKPKAREQKLKLRDFWVFSNKTSSTAQTPLKSFNVTTDADTSGSGIRVGSVVRSPGSCLQPLIVHPANKLVFLHATVQGAMILFDLVDFPLSAFHKGQAELAHTMLIASVAFWTWDMILSFLQGFYSSNGYIEMRPKYIALQYIRSWFLFDLVVISLDWLSLVLWIVDERQTSDTKVVRITKIGKVQRLARGGRMLRLLKHAEKKYNSLDGVAASEWIVVVAKIVGLLIGILVINHYIACAWYAIAEDSNSPETWVTVQMIEDSGALEKYIYSLHWSLTQFTPCTNNIAPANGIERLFASCVVLFALIVFSSFLSSLTSAIIQIKKLNWEWYNEQVQIRDFLHRKEISLMVASRIWHYYRKHYRARNKILAESDIHFFSLMPKSLRRELHDNAYTQTLVNHPVIKEVMFAQKRSIAPWLCEIVQTLIPISGQDIFLEAEEAACMYYFVNGKGSYHFGDDDQVEIMAPCHMTEAILWLRQWHHPGRLTVVNTQCELLLLSAASFVSCMESKASRTTVRSLRKYASLFAQHQEDMKDTKDDCCSWAGRCSDLPLDKEVHAKLTENVFLPDYGSSYLQLSGSSLLGSFFLKDSIRPRRGSRSSIRHLLFATRSHSGFLAIKQRVKHFLASSRA